MNAFCLFLSDFGVNIFCVWCPTSMLLKNSCKVFVFLRFTCFNVSLIYFFVDISVLNVLAFVFTVFLSYNIAILAVFIALSYKEV